MLAIVTADRRKAPIQPLLVNDDEASRLLAVSRSKFHTLVAEGLIPRLKLGRAARYRRADLIALTERLAVEAAGGATNATEAQSGLGLPGTGTTPEYPY
jgi:excisionase family DNA binding protein